jgi:hypothetical protein
MDIQHATIEHAQTILSIFNEAGKEREENWVNKQK